MIKARTAAILLAIVAVSNVARAQTSEPNKLTPAEKAAGWRLLFDGSTFNGWRGLGYDSVPDGALEGRGRRDQEGGERQRPQDARRPAGQRRRPHDHRLLARLRAGVPVEGPAGREQRREVQRLRGDLEAFVEPRGARLRVSGARRFAQRRQQGSVAPRRLAVRPHSAERHEVSPPRGPVEHLAHRAARQPRRALAQRNDGRLLRSRHAAHGLGCSPRASITRSRDSPTAARDTSSCRITATRRGFATSRSGELKP